MSGPATIQDFLALVRQSGLVEERTLTELMQRCSRLPEPLDTPFKLAGQMVKETLLTHFQADQLLQGRWRRFSIGRYKVLDQLGAGGMGAVYLCEHKHMRRRVAVKVLPIARTINSSCLERFYREARAIAALNHPNIVRAYDIDQDEALHFMAMEYVEGASLQDHVRRHGPLSPLQAVHYMRQAAHGLQHVYESGLVHRDIKPGNVLVDLTGSVKILDLGLARFYQDEADDVSVRHDEQVLGTVDYLSPEQALNSHDVDIRSDIYSLGCTIYYCLTGKPPFQDGTAAQKLIWHQTRHPKAIKHFRNDVPRDLVRLLDRAMAKRPRDRFQTPAELVEALGKLALLSGETRSDKASRTLTKPHQWWPKPRRWEWRWRWLEVALGALLLLGSAALLLVLLYMTWSGAK
ncbi:MAG: serine/threonine protein kinase [Planctomycetia bacterium]|nr:serine/threonine protein kinase [Planctomycetia bacterium]